MTFSLRSLALAILAIAALAGTVSVHLGESAEEIRFLRDGTGAWRDLLGQLGVWTDAWQPPGCGPVEYLERLGLVTPRLLGGPTYKVMSTLIYDEFLVKLDWPSGTAFSFILTAIALMVIWFGNRVARRFAGGAW